VTLSGPRVIDKAHYSGYEDRNIRKNTAMYAHT
jgi:hypothetical protein